MFVRSAVRPLPSLFVLVTAALALVLASCATSSSLTIQLRSDLVPGVEVERATYDVQLAGAPIASGSRDLLGMGSLGRPVRLAALDGIADGTYDVRVSLTRLRAIVSQRHVRVRVAGPTITTILVSRDCAGVACMDGDSDASTSCLGNRCVPIGCTEERPELCTAPECSVDADCAASALACVGTTCTGSHTCFDQPDDTRCAGGQICSTLAGCVSAPMGLSLDIADGLRANIVAGSASGTAATQQGREGWWYLYDPVPGFMTIGPLMDADMNPARYVRMEMARDDASAGWYAQSGLQIGQRGIVTFSVWPDPGGPRMDGDAVEVLAENSNQVVIEWRAPSAGHARMAVDLRTRSTTDGTVDAHLFVRHGMTSTELQHDYVSATATPDAYGRIPDVVSPDAPLHLEGAADLDADDSFFLYFRVGDNDAGDVADLRGGVEFAATP